MKRITAIVAVSMGTVAPHAGARIETSSTTPLAASAASLPTRERELKLKADHRDAKGDSVAPHAGARIETCRDNNGCGW